MGCKVGALCTEYRKRSVPRTFCSFFPLCGVHNKKNDRGHSGLPLPMSVKGVKSVQDVEDVPGYLPGPMNHFFRRYNNQKGMVCFPTEPIMLTARRRSLAKKTGDRTGV